MSLPDLKTTVENRIKLREHAARSRKAIAVWPKEIIDLLDDFDAMFFEFGRELLDTIEKEQAEQRRYENRRKPKGRNGMPP